MPLGTPALYDQHASLYDLATPCLIICFISNALTFSAIPVDVCLIWPSVRVKTFHTILQVASFGDQISGRYVIAGQKARPTSLVRGNLGTWRHCQIFLIAMAPSIPWYVPWLAVLPDPVGVFQELRSRLHIYGRLAVFGTCPSPQPLLTRLLT